MRSDRSGADDLPLATWLDRDARARGLDPAEVRVLAAHAFKLSRTAIAARGTPPGPAERDALEALLIRRAAGEPVAYLVGMREFFGRPFSVAPDVLIPRHETELLVERALRDAHDRALAAPRFLDLGTGSGAIAVTLALELPRARVVATDRSPAALATAQRNAEALGARRLTLRAGDWWAAIEPDERFDIVLSNPPYIRQDDHHLVQGDLRFEPRDALTDGADGLGALRAIVAGAPAHLAPGGLLLLEHGWDQAQAVRALLSAAGLQEARSWNDLAGIARVSSARMPVA